MPGAIERVLVELGAFFEPVADALDDPNDFAALLRRFGYNFDGPELSGAVAALGPMQSGVIALIDLAETAVENGFDKSDLEAVANAAQPVFEHAREIAQPFSGLVPQGMSAGEFAATLADLPEDLLNLLLTDYLSDRVPEILHILAILAVHRPEPIPATGSPGSRGVAFVRHHYDWEMVALIFRDPEAWAREAYGWGIDFDSDTATRRAARLFEFIGGVAELREMTDEQKAVFMPHLAGTQAAPLIALAPLLSEQATNADGSFDLAAEAEMGLALLPVAGAGAQRETDSGLAVGPYAEGTVSASVNFGPGIDLTVSGSVGAVGGAIFKFQPSGADFVTGLEAAALSGAFGMELVVGPDDPQGKLVFIGDAQSTRVQADAVVVKMGGDVSNAAFDFYVAAGVNQLTAVIDPGDDGLLSAVISDPITISAGDIALGWRHGRGIYFEGGTNLGITIPVEISLGPVNIHEFGLAFDFNEPPAMRVTTTADITLGPLYAYAEGIGISATLVPATDGIFGSRDLAFGFVPPTGYAVALNAEPVEGGGMLSIGDNEYRGALALKFQTFGFSAFGILNTRLPDGRDGFSFAASIFGEFNVPLGFGFFLTGLGGVIGINRTVDTDALRTVLYEGRLDNILFPDDPIENAKTILDDMAAILPVREGQHLFGPVAKIGWGQPILIEVKLGLVLEIGDNVRILILGGLSANLPTKESALVALNITFFGEIDFGAGTISFDATLQNSRVLNWGITGDAAIRTGWAPRIEHVVSFGGLHPQFPKPSNLPDLRRMSINFGTNNPKITLAGYHAVTSNSLQFGARADLYAKGPKIWLVGQLAAEGWIYLDALIYFNPFSFDVMLGGGINLLRNGNVVCALGFELRLRGPNTFKINGKVWVTVFGIDVDFGVNHTWGSRKSLPTETVDAVTVLRNALEKISGFEPVQPQGRRSGVGFAEGDDIEAAVDPLAGVRLVQRALPLGVTIEKIGEAQTGSGANRLDLKVFTTDGAEATVTAANLDFVRGHFFNLSESERLRATAFDTHKAGFELAADDLTGPVGKAIEEDYAYEIIEIPIEQDDPLVLHGAFNANATLINRFAYANLQQVARPQAGFSHEFIPPEPITVKRDNFVADTAVDKVIGEVDAIGGGVSAGTVRDSILDGGLAEMTLTGAVQRGRAEALATEAVVEANPVVADYVAAAARF